MSTVRAHMRKLHDEGAGNDVVFVPLNVLAIAAAYVIAGTGNDPKAREFFDTALEQQIKLVLEDKEERALADSLPDTGQ